MTITTTLARFEAVDGAYAEFIRMGDFMDCDDPRGYIRASNRLLDACIAAGMAYDHPDHHLWAAEFICACMASATLIVEV
jgi:hypothetical protein